MPGFNQSMWPQRHTDTRPPSSPTTQPPSYPFMRGAQGAYVGISIAASLMAPETSEVSALPAQITCQSQRPLLSHPAQMAAGEGQSRTQRPAKHSLCYVDLPRLCPVPWPPCQSGGNQEPASLASPCSSQWKAATPTRHPALPHTALLPLSFSREERGEDIGGKWICESRALAEGDLGLLSTEGA